MSLSANTNLSALKVKNNLNKSTNAVNTAIERMTTGYRINSAKDDAAGMAIATKMNTKISASEVAESNVEIGNSMISTASSTLDIITEHLQRIRDLSIQANNGTYSQDSIDAINAEVSQRVDEINRITKSTEYNDIQLFGGTVDEEALKQKLGITDIYAKSNGFIADIDIDTPDITCDNTTVRTAQELKDIIVANGTIGIADADTLKLLADVVNGTGGVDSAYDCSGKTICLTDDIDLSAYGSSYDGGKGWVAIGNGEVFAGTFNGNGHVVKNLYINRPTEDWQGLFEYTYGGELKNVGVVDCNVTGKNGTGALAGGPDAVTNCYSTGTVKGGQFTGGLVGDNSGLVNNCYSTCDVTGTNCVGGLVGFTDAEVTNSYATGKVTGDGTVGGLVGAANYDITNCYATGNVSGGDSTGGLAGSALEDVSKCYATGNVVGTEQVGGLVGWYAVAEVSNSYATGNVTGNKYVGGLMGFFDGDYPDGETYNFDNIHSYSSVTGNTGVGMLVGGIGNTDGTDTDTVNITNSSVKSNTSINPVGANYKLTDPALWTYTDISDTPEGKAQLNTWNSGIEQENLGTKIDLQIGITSSDNSRISFETGVSLSGLNTLKNGVNNRQAIDTVDSLLATISAKQTEFGAIQNRLDGITDQLQTSSENLVSSLGTVQDADIAKESSSYIQKQILQQASATLLSTANQSASIALQLI